MSLDAPRGTFEDIADDEQAYPVIARETLFAGLIFDVVRDEVDLGDGGVVTRDHIAHPGAVVVVALREIDGVDHVMLIRQYRHAAGGHLWELPAGLRDQPDEPLVDAAARELAEEVDLHAESWHTLTDTMASAGILPEAVRIFLARDLRDVPEEERHERHAEELTIRPLWVPLDDAVRSVLAGRVGSVSTCLGILATQVARSGGWEQLRPADAAHPVLPRPLQVGG